MAAGDTTITIVGNLVDDPELRFTPTGQAVARFRIASTPRFLDKQTNEWKDGEGLFLTCNVWRQAAENVAESLQRGMRVIVQGRLRQRSYETKEGEKRTVYEVEVDEVGPSLKNATAKVNKTARQGGGGGFGGGGPANDPWASSAPAAPQGGGNYGGGGGNYGGQQSGGNFGGGQPQGGGYGGGNNFGGGDFSDEPPF
ncbi:single-stranded DNA-binding protein [Streptosporangium sp. NPDC051022]|uniref:single-stranded DNA-binding protein n=1 Tax=Streptosporangium sp. NPDC051022 TaxID=3155752 RepID=UPI00341D18C1